MIEQAALDGAGTVRRIQEFSRQTTDTSDEQVLADLTRVVRDTVAQTAPNWESRGGGSVALELDVCEQVWVHADARGTARGPYRWSTRARRHGGQWHAAARHRRGVGAWRPDLR